MMLYSKSILLVMILQTNICVAMMQTNFVINKNANATIVTQNSCLKTETTLSASLMFLNIPENSIITSHPKPKKKSFWKTVLIFLGASLIASIISFLKYRA
jgi:hypothetical protein